ncbi:MAG TPA: hypothetical protein VF247_01050 [Candidatus Krumholzibacteria bacterium]
MISSRCPHARMRLAAFSLLAATGLALSIFSCSQDDPNTLGSDSDLLGSEPGLVSQDTIGVFADTVYAMKTPIAVEQEIELGMDSLYTRALILQPSFSGLTDQMKTASVTAASLRLPPVEVATSFPVRFFGYGKRYAQGDTVNIDALADSMILVDPETNSDDRHIEFADALHALEPADVETWTDDDTKREAIVIEYTDTTNERMARFVAVENTDSAASLFVTFGSPVSAEKRFSVVADATVYRPRYTTTNLIVSDGYPRRVYFRTQIDSLAKDASVHTARIRFHIVPNTNRGTTTDNSSPPKSVKGVRLLLYIPDDPDPTKPEFKNGQRITEQLVLRAAETVDFPLTNALFLILQGTLKDNGFAIRMKDENTLLRQVELYGTDAPDSLRPQVFVTTSTPAVFH